MMAVKVASDIYWVGAVDWDVRDFHGYSTNRGATYNAYLIIDDQVTLVDTVKSNFSEEMIRRISSVIDPSKIKNIICNHVELDHSGALPAILKHCPNASVYCSPKGEEGLKLHYEEDFKCKIVTTGNSLNVGKRTLQFVATPMVHWPDNMVSYCPEDKILFSNDGFGQHYASNERFDDECPLDIVMDEAKKYYANIVLPFGSMVQKELSAASQFDIQTIAPSHGVIWRSNISNVIAAYKKWSANETQKKAVIVYATMWHSTEKMAHAIYEAFEERNIKAELYDLKQTHISDIMKNLMDAEYICVGSPTLNNNLMPAVSAFLTYMKGLAPKNRKAIAFGSYGWGGQSIGQVEEVLKACNFELLGSIKERYIPTQETLDGITKRVKGVV